jgi:hypothetical protein
MYDNINITKTITHKYMISVNFSTTVPSLSLGGPPLYIAHVIHDTEYHV